MYESQIQLYISGLTIPTCKSLLSQQLQFSFGFLTDRITRRQTSVDFLQEFGKKLVWCHYDHYDTKREIPQNN